MKGQTCGLCGKADGEVRQEYRTPSGRVTKNAASYAHSWVVPAESCRDNSGKTHGELHLNWFSKSHEKHYIHQKLNYTLPFSYRVPYEA